MKNIIAAILLLFSSLPFAGAQHYVGVRGGYGGGSVRFDPKMDTKMLWNRYSGGVSWKYYSAERYLGGVEIDVEMLQKGYRRIEYNKPDTSYVWRSNSITMPIMWQPHFYFFKRSLRVFLNAGVTFCYNFDADYEYVSQRSGTYESGEYHYQLNRDNQWGYGIVGGGGAGILVGRFEYFAEARYYFGFSDIYKNPNKYKTNPERSPLDNFNISVGICYRLGKGGILAPPSKRVAEKMRRTQDNGNRKQPSDTDDVTIPKEIFE